MEISSCLLQAYINLNTNSQTMSTKCQYHAAVSKPICFEFLISALKNRIKHNHNSLNPTTTCAPCKPVSKKKQQPKPESATVKGLIEYSDAWIITKNSPSIKVYIKPLITELSSFARRA
jgi:hypothetical protein